MAITRGDSKRMRTSHHNNLHINDLPEAALVSVALYLPKLSRALLAVALTAPSSSWPKSNNNREQPQLQLSETCKAITNFQDQGQWELIDFVEIEKSLASKLSDDDIGAILVCTNAVDKLKRLKLTGCVNITGSGLWPLSGSVRIEQIDLSLVKQHESPDIQSEPMISVTSVVPILNTIVGKDGNALKQLQFPAKWRGQDTILSQFLGRYSRLLDSRPFDCSRSRCSGDRCRGRPDYQPWIEVQEDGLQLQLQLQYFTCYTCLKNSCFNDDSWSQLCCKCYKHHCAECIEIIQCDNVVGERRDEYQCEERYCVECVTLTWCEQCRKKNCPTCAATCACCKQSTCHECARQCHGGGPMYSSQMDCGKLYCEECWEGGNIQRCGFCSRYYCSDCVGNAIHLEDGGIVCNSYCRDRLGK